MNSLRTWESSGMLDMVSERLALLNDPLPQEHAMALQHGFEVLQPKDIPNVKVRRCSLLCLGPVCHCFASVDFVFSLQCNFLVGFFCRLRSRMWSPSVLRFITPWSTLRASKQRLLPCYCVPPSRLLTVKHELFPSQVPVVPGK